MIAFRRSLFDQCDHPCRSFRRCESCTKNTLTPINDVRRDRHSQDGKLNFSCHTANEFAERVQKFGASPELEIHKYRISMLCLTVGTSERFTYLSDDELEHDYVFPHFLVSLEGQMVKDSQYMMMSGALQGDEYNGEPAKEKRSGLSLTGSWSRPTFLPAPTLKHQSKQASLCHDDVDPLQLGECRYWYPRLRKHEYCHYDQR